MGAPTCEKEEEEQTELVEKSSSRTRKRLNAFKQQQQQQQPMEASPLVSLLYSYTMLAEACMHSMSVCWASYNIALYRPHVLL